MAFERKWPGVAPVSFTADGGQWGMITLSDTAGFRVKQVCAITSDSLPPLPVQVKIVLSPTTLMVGNIDNQIANWKPIDLRAYTVAQNSKLSAETQDKNKITNEDIQKAVYEADPVVALRTAGVDEYGNFYTPNNPVPVSPVGGSVDKAWDDLVITRNPITQDIATAVYKFQGNTVSTLTFVYDAYENLIEVIKT